jgi:hypothetical protein
MHGEGISGLELLANILRLPTSAHLQRQVVFKLGFHLPLWTEQARCTWG